MITRRASFFPIAAGALNPLWSSKDKTPKDRVKALLKDEDTSYIEGRGGIGLCDQIITTERKAGGSDDALKSRVRVEYLLQAAKGDSGKAHLLGTKYFGKYESNQTVIDQVTKTYNDFVKLKVNDLPVGSSGGKITALVHTVEKQANKVPGVAVPEGTGILARLDALALQAVQEQLASMDSK
jgi:hypothetical protein